jgi:hypothetical protein
MNAIRIVEMWVKEELNDVELRTEGFDQTEKVKALYIKLIRLPHIGSIALFFHDLSDEVKVVFPDGHVRDRIVPAKDMNIKLANPEAFNVLKKVVLEWKERSLKYMAESGKIPGYSPPKTEK